jgi:hypothetical protein
MPGLDDIDDDGPLTAPSNALTMDDIFGGMGTAPQPKPVSPAPQPTAGHPAPRATNAVTSPSSSTASMASGVGGGGGTLDDFFAPTAASPQSQHGGAAPVKKSGLDLLGSATAVTQQGPKQQRSMEDYVANLGTQLKGGGSSNVQTLASMVSQDRPYVPPASVLALMTHYEVLGIARNATSEEISRVYRKMALAYHPDKRGAELTPEEESYFKAITTANEILSDADKRRAYDAESDHSVQQQHRQTNLFTHF